MKETPVHVQRGTLLQFSGSWSSGLGFLIIADCDTNEFESVPCENGPTVRALEGCFGNVITEGHMASGDGYKGKEVYWSRDGFTLAAFTPVDEASKELIQMYKAYCKYRNVKPFAR